MNSLCIDELIFDGCESLRIADDIITLYNSRPCPTDQHPHYVYVIYNPLLGLTKIGIASDFDRRKQELENSSGVKMDFMFLLSNHFTVDNSDARWYEFNTGDVESTLHRFFKDKRHIGEWFKLSVVDLLAIGEFLKYLGILEKDAFSDYGSYQLGKKRSRIPERYRYLVINCGGELSLYKSVEYEIRLQ